MTIYEYTSKRAETLFKLNIPEIESPINLKIWWLDNLTSRSIAHRICLDTHSHSFFEVHFVFSGKAYYECQGTSVELGSGQSLLIPPNVSHRYIGCDKNLVKSTLAFSLGENPIPSVVFPSEKYMKFEFRNDVVENVNYILRLSDQQDLFVPDIIGGRIIEIIYSICNALQLELPNSSDTKIDSRVLVAQKYIESNKNRIINSSDVAKECCLSQKQLNRLFLSYTGSSLFEYITNIRIRYAKKLLLQSTFSVKEISFMMGFENECSFVSFFKRHCELPPGIFRKQNLGGD